MIRRVVLIFIIPVFLFIFAYNNSIDVVYSQGNTPPPASDKPKEFEGLVSIDCAGTNPADCTINSFIQTAINILQWILAVMSVAAFAYFIYGGFVFLTSGGSSQRVEKGKNILVNTVIGIILILSAFTIIRVIGDILLQKNIQDYNRFLQDQKTNK